MEKAAQGKRNVNQTVLQGLTNIGAGPTFYDNLVEVEKKLNDPARIYSGSYRTVMKVLAMALLLLVPSVCTSLAQGICVIDEMRVQIMRGCVTDPNGLAVSGATLELYKKGSEEVIARVMTKEDGCFSFSGVVLGE